MARKKAVERKVAIIDLETDPFKFGRVPQPFAAGVLHDGPSGLPIYREFWGDKCVDLALDYLASITEPLCIYAHNGGKFDFHYWIERLSNPIKVIHGRLVKARFHHHEFRDSFAIIPIGLKRANAKTEIDYAKFESVVREKHRREILDYLRDDCTYLHQLVRAFVDRFGFRLTVAGTAMRELRALHPQFNQAQDHDVTFRQFYFGGRVECFKHGVLKGTFNVYDVNSMYPSVMRDFRHPIGRGYVSPAHPMLDAQGWLAGFPGYFYFIHVIGHNKRALPVRGIKAGDPLRFDVDYGEFFTTSHELRASLELGLFTVTSIVAAYVPQQTQRFDTFVDTFMADKISAKQRKDKIAETFAKLILNSAYGRFGINPREFHEYVIQGPNDERPDSTFEPFESNDKFVIWRKPTYQTVNGSLECPNRAFEDVAIAASITSAARSVLMRAIASAYRPVYCDTDSLICEDLTGVKFDDSALGAWKLEARGDRLAIAGKKLYALFDGDKEVKIASKGVRLTAKEIEDVASGGEVLWRNDAPSYSLTSAPRFIHRVAKSTAGIR